MPYPLGAGTMKKGRKKSVVKSKKIKKLPPRGAMNMGTTKKGGK